MQSVRPCVGVLRGLKSRGPALQLWRYQRRFSTRLGPLSVSDEVIHAVKTRQPVVALETTIYTHGFPYPENIALSSSLEALVREQGAVPATIGILNGVAIVGMQPTEIAELLEKAGDPNTIKVSRRDLGFICARNDYCGGTTIAGTLVLAHLAGIKVFATGGLGGVHRDKPGETSMDISADLTELGRTPLALISSGCKSFLDLPRTLEFLETQGVGVGTFADGREGPVKFPSFWTRESDVQSPNTIKDEKEAAAILHAQLQLPLESGLLFANPVSLEYSLPNKMMDEITSQAVTEAAEKGILGSANTPYILSRIRELTKGATVLANRKLVEGNVIRGTRVAVELAKLESKSASNNKHKHTNLPAKKISADSNIDVLVAGSIALDLNCNYQPRSTKGSTSIAPGLHTSNPASIQQTLGGVGQNVATASHYMGASTMLCSIVGDDAAGNSAKSMLSSRGMRTDGITVAPKGTTAQYIALNDLKKDLFIAMADMRVFETPATGFDTTWRPILLGYKPEWVILDANWSPESLQKWLLAAKEAGSKIAFEPVSVAKSTGLLTAFEGIRNGSSLPGLPSSGQLVDLVTPNQLEVQAMADAVPVGELWAEHMDHLADTWLSTLSKQQFRTHQLPSTQIVAAALRLLSVIPRVLTKLGADGVLQAEMLHANDPRHTDAHSKQHIFYAELPGNGPKAELVSDATLKPENMGSTIAVYLRHHPAQTVKKLEDIVSVNGVGDTLLGALVALLSRNPRLFVEDAIGLAQAAALETLMCNESVSPTIRGLRQA